ncbi:hypothetical protein DYB32_002773 [Aphanomyces invadans]|uniref:Condensin complex subunit 1 N-terminal domain-containing protein n=1 Tax=Aphanomyces invadans TaxID=157072 RepID=A0A418B2A5_9STRA|nr:hypothetical protein DYB32_002773 [Aphanomyces invadans]
MDASDGASKAAATLADLPPLNDAPAADRTKLFRQKLRLCCVVMDFSEPRKQVREKDVKRQALLELVQFLSDGKVTWSSQVVEDLMVCVEANIIRPLGGKSRTSGAKEGGRIEGVEEDEPVLEESWPHLQLIYELLYRFVLSKEVDTKSAKEYFSKRFMLQLLNLFDSEDPRERDYLKVGRGSSASPKHRCRTVQSLTFNVLKLLMEMDSQLFDQCSAQLDEREGKQQHTFEERRRKWRQLEAAASVQ